MERYSHIFNDDLKIEHEKIKRWRVVANSKGSRDTTIINSDKDEEREILTGDILFFNGSSIVSSGIKLMSHSNWNHIGMACWLELTYDNIITDEEDTIVELWCYEMGSLSFKDLITMEIAHMKTRLVRLTEIGKMYDMISVRHINHIRDETFCQRFEDFMLKYKGTPFYKSSFTLLKTFVFSPGAPEGEVSCSHLVSVMMDEMNIYKPQFDPSQFCPGHYSSECDAFPPELFYGPEVPIYHCTTKLNVRTIVAIVIIIILVAVAIVLYANYKPAFSTTITSKN